MKHTIEIRELGPDDAPEYKAMRVAAATDPAFGLDPEAEAAYSVELLAQALRQKDGSYVLGAFDAEQLVAIVGYGRGMTPGTGTLFGLFVKDGWRRRHIGTELCRTLISAHPGCAIRLEVARDNVGAISLYESLGFVAQDAPGDTGSIVMVMPPVDRIPS